jgi:hypothetical protein
MEGPVKEISPPSGSAPSGTVPFDGLVREVTRWLGGDVILARRGAEGEDEDDEQREEQETGE